MKIIITHPDFDDPGGVAKYYAKLKNKFSTDVHHYVIGKRPGNSGKISSFIRILLDYWHFFLTVCNNNVRIIHLNPSLDRKSLLREGIFIIISKLFGKKVVVFFRGWHKKFEARLEKNKLWLFKRIFGKVDRIIVLSNEVKAKLREWGFTQPIYLEVTVIEDKSVLNLDFGKILKRRKNSKKKKLLFLSRIIKQKGIYETIDALVLLNAKYSQLELVVAGDGPELENVKVYSEQKNIHNIAFPGYVKNGLKDNLLAGAYLFCFPSYGEGMPNALIEAMAFGLPAVTRMVGGIPDIFTSGKNGYGTLSKDPKVIAGLIDKLLSDTSSYETMCRTNYEYARTNFLASRAAERLDKIYQSLLPDKTVSNYTI